MLDVVRHAFLPPPAARKAADVEFVLGGGELLVSCWLVPARTGKLVAGLPHGLLHVFRDRVVWEGSRRQPELTFDKSEWFVRPSSLRKAHGKFALISIINRVDLRVHQEIRVPAPDEELVRAIMGRE